jgi:hypothetical protein
LTIIAKNIVIVGQQEAVPTLKHEQTTQVRVPPPPVVQVTPTKATIVETPVANVAVAKLPDFIDKPSEYVSSMFRLNK